MSRSCDLCGTVEAALKRCSGCKKAVYCSRVCQKTHWPEHREPCAAAAAAPSRAPSTGDSGSREPSFRTIELRHGKTRRSVQVRGDCCYGDLERTVSSLLRLRRGELKLVHRGRLLSAKHDVAGAVAAGGPFLAIGTPEEDAGGLHEGDVELLMKQLGLDRGSAIRTLREHVDVIDAMINHR